MPAALGRLRRMSGSRRRPAAPAAGPVGAGGSGSYVPSLRRLAQGRGAENFDVMRGYRGCRASLMREPLQSLSDKVWRALRVAQPPRPAVKTVVGLSNPGFAVDRDGVEARSKAGTFGESLGNSIIASRLLLTIKPHRLRSAFFQPHL